MKKKKILIILLVVLLIVGIGLFSYFYFFKSSSNSEDDSSVEQIKVTNEISDYGYVLDDRDSDIFKEKFEELKSLLSTEDYDEKEYITLVSELFIIDLYTLDNKISKYDVGGLEFVYEPARDSFKGVIMDSIYKSIVNNIDDNRKQSLPAVTNVNVEDISESSYTLPDDSVVSAYDVDLSWTYKTALGYDNEGVLTLISNDKKYDVVAFEPKN